MKFISKEKIFILILFLFSLLINQYYGNKGIFPVDSFSHFDTGFRILLGEHPFKDYWTVSGPLIDYLQAIIFYLFGVSWQSYVLHASLINALVSIVTFVILINLKLNIYHSFFYDLIFSVLAYPTSGTPFVDHHSTFFSLLGIYSLILGIKKEEKKYWILLPIFFTFAFFSKQVPSSYIILSSTFVLVLYTIIKRKFFWIKYSLLSFVLIIITLLIFGKIQSINLYSFLEQYIYYPQSIGSERFNNFTLNGTLGHFKFIYVAILPLFFVNLKRIVTEKSYLKNEYFYYFLILFLFTFSLILHQLLTRNQTYIFFLIPILFAFSDININFLKIKKIKMISIVLILICLFAATKYHIRFNENRKFHELNYVNFKLSLEASKIDKKLSGLKWITPEYKNKAEEEINLITEIKSHLVNDNKVKMLMSNYSFFSAILDEKIFSPSRWYLFDGTDFPTKENKYFRSYKNLLIKLIKTNNIEVIYTIYPVENSLLYIYFDKSCFNEKKITSILSSYEILKDCQDFNY